MVGSNSMRVSYILAIVAIFSLASSFAYADDMHSKEMERWNVLSKETARTGTVSIMSGSTTTKKFRGYTGSGMSCIWPPTTHTATIDVTDINISTIQSATLTVRAYDCDNPDVAGECDGGPEIDTVIFNGNYIGILTGATNQWSTVSFPIAKAAVQNGTNTVLVYIDTTATGCWCLGVDWAELALEIKDIDLYVNSSEIVITRTSKNRYRMTAKVRNLGETDAENVNVKTLETYLGGNLVVVPLNVGTIAAGGVATVTHNFIAIDIGNYKLQVIADPSSAIDETNENNNEGETYKVTGQIKETQSATNPLKRMQVDLEQADGANWQSKWTTFTDDHGDYAINLNMQGIEYNKNTRINGSLHFSPTKSTGDIKIRVIHDSTWGAGSAPSPNARALAKTTTVDADLKHKDYRGKDLQYNAVEGGSVYQAVTQAYLYWMQAPVSFEIDFRLDAEVADNDYDTSYYSSLTKTLHVHHTRLSAAQGWGHHSTSHEYAHRVMPTGVGFPYGPGGPGDGTKENGVGENWANYASSLARNDGSPHGSAGWTHDMTTDTMTLSGGWPWSMADVWWDLDRQSITTAGGNKVVETIRNHQPMTTSEQFFVNYTNDHPGVNVSSVKVVFRRHGYNTTGWKGRGGVDPDAFTGNFSEQTPDEDSDGLFDALIIDVEITVNESGTYYVYAYLTDPVTGYSCFAINDSSLSVGTYNVSLIYDGQCIYRNRLNGALEVREAYWEDESASLYEYRDNLYNTSTQNYLDYDFGLAATTGVYTDSVVDTNSNGKDDYLVLTAQVNITEAGNYSINGYLYDMGRNFIASSHNSSYLSVGTQNVDLAFSGNAIYANAVSGTYQVKNINIYGENASHSSNSDPLQEAPLYIDEMAYTTSSYTYTDFEPSGSSITGTSEGATDTNGNGFYDILHVNVSISVASSGDYGIAAYLRDSTGTIIAKASTYQSVTSTATLQLNFSGDSIRRNAVDGPYDLNYTLQDLGEITLARASSQSAAYSYADFEMSGHSNFNIDYADNGADTNSNGLYDFLVLDLNISTNLGLTYGNYEIIAYVYSENGSIVSRNNITEQLNNQSGNFQINISGQDIWRTRLSNSAYNVTLQILDIDDNYSLATEIDDAHTTAPYSYNEFDAYSAWLSMSNSDTGVDTDSNGLYNYLRVSVGVNSSVNASFTLMGYLYDANGTYIAGAQNTDNLTAGSNTIQLNFDGYDVYDAGINGTYVLGIVMLYDENGTLIAYGTNIHTTGSYSYTDFERLQVIFSGDYADYGVDANNDSMYESLVITVGVIVENAGTYGINARIVDNNSREIVWALNSSSLTTNGTQTLTLIFNGQSIYGNAADGPYYLQDVHVYNTQYSGQSNSIHSAYTTSAYDYVDFQISGIVSGYVLDVNGSPVENSVVSYSGDSDVTGGTGSYSLMIPSNDTYTITAGFPYASDYLSNSTSVDAVIGGTTEANITLQHEGIIAGKILYENGTAVNNADIVLGAGPTSGDDTSNSTGDYYINRLHEGNYSLSVTPPSIVNLLPTAIYGLVAYGETSAINITMPTGGILEGVVLAVNGTEVYNARVQISAGSDYSDSSGNYSINRLNGTYSITATPPTGANLLGNTTINVSVADAEVIYQNISLRIGGILTGVVLAVNGTEVYNARVLISVGSDYSDSSGNYSIDRLNGNYSITATPPTGTNLLRNTTINVSVADGEVIYQNISLRIGGIITGVVMDTDGNPVSSNRVSVSLGPTSGYDYTNGTGVYEIMGLENGNYTVTASNNLGRNLLSNSVNATVVEGQTSIKNISLLELPELYINENTTLSGGILNMQDPESDGAIIINASNVVLDCNGSTINGTDVGYGIYLNGFANVTIVNCNVMNYDRGIYIRYSSSGNNVTNNNVTSNDNYGIYYQYTNNDSVTYNVMRDNQYGMYMSNSYSNVISDNDASYNSQYGIYLYYSDYNNFTSNYLSSNGYSGFYAHYSDYNRFEGNEVTNHSDSSDYGMRLYSSLNTTILRNRLHNNGRGVYMQYNDRDTRIYKNTFDSNGYGTYITSSSTGNLVYNNNFMNSTTSNAYDTLNNSWDNGSVMGGNYWDDHNVSGDPSDGSTPYNVSGNSGAFDNYPFESYFGWTSDNTPPLVRRLLVTPSRKIRGLPVTILARAQDYDTEISSVYANVTLPDASVVSLALSKSVLDYTGYFSSTQSVGNYTIRIVATDRNGNVNSTQTVQFEIVDNITSTTTSNVTNGTTITVDATDADTVLEITTSENVTDANVNVTLSANATGSAFDRAGLGKYVQIQVSQGLLDVIQTMLLKIYYTEAELSVSGIDEGNIGLFYYNVTLDEWQGLDNDTMGWVLSTGVDSQSNFVWAQVTHVGTFTIGLDSQLIEVGLVNGWNLISTPLVP